jgi:hypothetical protein
MTPIARPRHASAGLAGTRRAQTEHPEELYGCAPLVDDAPLDPLTSASPDAPPEPLDVLVSVDEDELLDVPPAGEPLLLFEVVDPLDEPLLDASSDIVASGGADASPELVLPAWIEMLAQ